MKLLMLIAVCAIAAGAYYHEEVTQYVSNVSSNIASGSNGVSEYRAAGSVGTSIGNMGRSVNRTYGGIAGAINR